MFRIAAGSALAVATLSGGPVIAQTTHATTGTTQDAGTPTQQAPRITPKQVIDVIGTLIKKRPAPTPAPVPTTTATPTATATPTPVPTFTPPPRPAVVATPAPAPRPSASAAPRPRPTPAAVPTPAPSAASPSVPAEAAASEAPPPPPQVPVPVEVTLPVPPAPPATPLWPRSPLGLVLATIAAAAWGLYRWFWPKIAVTCEVAVGPDTLGAASSPAISLPEASIDIRIEIGDASAPRGLILAPQGGQS